MAIFNKIKIVLLATRKPIIFQLDIQQYIYDLNEIK
jgi:hypothetical protein